MWYINKALGINNIVVLPMHGADLNHVRFVEIAIHHPVNNKKKIYICST